MPEQEPKKKFYVAKMTPPEKDVQNPNLSKEHDPFNMTNASSYSDCTGLIPTPPLTEEEEESYMSIYDYQPPDVWDRTDDQSEEKK